ncbi:MAG: hypothetical protein DRN54_04125 [Thaumarchaeota archaeon]|nr:MAG: hypothetical protein DRN54_04125 [Nitrososphaerota archaeon]
MTPEERAKLESIVKGTLEKQGIEVTPEVLTANLLTVLGAYTQLLRSEELLKTRYEYGLKYLEDLEKQLKAYEEQVRKLEEWERGLGDITKIKQEVEKFLFSPPVITITPEEVRGKAIAKLTAVTEEDIKELVTHPQLAVREKEEYYTLLEKALEKYFPTKFPEDTLTGQMMKFAEKLPTGVREVVEFGAGVVAPFEEWREMGGWFGFEQPNVPTYTGGMISGFLAGSTEELRIATKRPAYTAGTIVGEFIQDYLLGKAIAKGLAKFFGWVESKVPKTPEGRWIVTHYPPITRRVLRGLEKLKNLLIEQKQIAKTIEEVRDIGVYRFDLEEGIEGISKSLIRIAEKDIGDIVEDLRLLKKGDIVGGELKEARKFIPEDIGKTPSFALRYEPTYERIDLGDIAEFTRRMEKLGAKEGIMFRAVEREGIRVPQLFDIRIGKKGLMVTRYTPTITFEKFPVKFIEEGTEEFLGRFKPEYIKIKPEDVEDFLKKPPEGASWDEWYKYYQKKLEIGKRKYAVKPPEVPEEIKLKPPEVEEDVFRTIKGRGATDVEGLTAVSVSEDMKQLLKVVQRTEGIEELTLRTPSILGITTRRTVRTPTLPLTLLIPRVGVKERELLLEVEEEKPKVEEKPVLDIKLEELGREFFIPVRIRYKPTLSFREISRSLGGFTRVPGVYTPSPKLFTPTAVKPTTRIRQAELTVPKLLELETTQTLPSLSTGVEEKIVPPIIPPLFLPGGAYPRKFGITRWRRWISEWFGFEPRILKAKSKTKTKGKRRRKSKKKGRKSKRRGRRK